MTALPMNMSIRLGPLRQTKGKRSLSSARKLRRRSPLWTTRKRIFFWKNWGCIALDWTASSPPAINCWGLISYLTAGPTETRAWTIQRGTLAPQAAGKIHSDFERGFIRAEVVSYDDLMACGSYPAAKEKGLVRSEGKEYEVKDGDVILFRFNV